MRSLDAVSQLDALDVSRRAVHAVYPAQCATSRSVSKIKLGFQIKF